MDNWRLFQILGREVMLTAFEINYDMKHCRANFWRRIMLMIMLFAS